MASALILYIRTGQLPSFISNKPSLFDVFKRVGSAILTVTGLATFTKISD